MSRRRRTVLIASAVAGTLVLVTAGVGTYAYLHLNHNLHSFSEAGVSTSRPPIATAAPPVAGQPAPQAPINLLLIGSDSRGGTNQSLGGGAGVAGARSDTTILLHISGDRKHAVGVSIPRDALVDVPACEANGEWIPAQQHVMFNSAFAEGNSAGGNPTCTQNTVEAMTGLRIDHTIVLDFAGFATMSSAVGGVPVCVPTVDNSALEQAYGITLTPGLQRLSGQAALDYVRAREGFGDNSDIGRMLRQQAFMSALVKQALGQGTLSDPLAMYRLADAATKSITVDPSLDSISALVGLGLQLKSIPLAGYEFVTTPWAYDGSRVDLVEPATSVLWQLLRQDRTLEGTDASGGATSAAAAASGTPTPAAAAQAPAAAAATATEKPDKPKAGTASSSSSPGLSDSAPISIPSQITDNIRNATADPCSNLSFGTP